MYPTRLQLSATAVIVEGAEVLDPADPKGLSLAYSRLGGSVGLGFRFAHVEIPTVYGDETSHLSPTRDVPRIVGMMLRLTFEPRPRA